MDVGLDYLTLGRAAGTLAGGEAQRIRLATQIGSGLVGVLYILDEPSIGLHQRDNRRLIDTLLRLRDLGNTLIVVEHDEATIMEADHIVDIGPLAGELGGEIVYSGDLKGLLEEERSITGAYLSGRRADPDARRCAGRPAKGVLRLEGVREHNLQNITVDIPLGLFVCVTGVSRQRQVDAGPGRAAPGADAEAVPLARCSPASIKRMTGWEQLDKVIDIDQSPIGRTPRSNPATYTGVFDHIRKLFAQVPEARIRGFQPGRFSFNVRGGRCENCAGDGQIKIEMHFLPDVYVTCEVCKGRRYNRETLEVKYKGRSIADVLEMSVEEALEFFRNIPPIHRHMQTLSDVGLGLHQARAAGADALGRRGAAHQARRPSCTSGRPATPSTSWTNPPPVCTSRTSASCSVCCSAWSRPGTPSWSSSTTWMWSRRRTGSSTSGRRAGTWVDGWSRPGTPEQIAAFPDSHTGRFLAEVLGRPAVADAEEDALQLVPHG